MTLTDEEREILTTILYHYLRNEYRSLADMDKVIDSRESIITEIDGVNTLIYKYPCPCQAIYLDEDNEPVTYAEQCIIYDDITDTMRYRYDFKEYDPRDMPWYEDLGPVDWHRDEPGGGGVQG